MNHKVPTKNEEITNEKGIFSVDLVRKTSRREVQGDEANIKLEALAKRPEKYTGSDRVFPETTIPHRIAKRITIFLFIEL